MNPDLSNPGAAVVAEVVRRAASTDYETWWSKVTDSGFCAAPVRLVADGPVGPGEILARCKNRRASVCPSCSQLYAGDTWQLVHAGIVGEDGAAASDVHPMVFATLTAPSFGAVHTAASSGADGSIRACHPGRPGGACDHGRPSGCTAVHRSGDATLGEPLCLDCYDYLTQILFTWHAPELWHRFTIVLRRLVARFTREAGDGASGVKIAYVKVVEMQRRAVPHFHTVIRLDHEDQDAHRLGIGVVELGTLIRQAANQVALGVTAGRRSVTLRFGEQLDVRPLHEVSGSKVAAYLAKYVTKSVGDFGLTARRIHEGVIDELVVSDHIRRILHTIADLARDPQYRELGTWLHTIGYRGHITTKTRGFSTTMGELRARRDAWRRDQRRAEGEDNGAAPDPGETEWRYTGCGHATEGERFLAISAAGRNREMRQAAREALSSGDGHE
jgi:hypothetical protein